MFLLYCSDKETEAQRSHRTHPGSAADSNTDTRAPASAQPRLSKRTNKARVCTQQGAGEVTEQQICRGGRVSSLGLSVSNLFDRHCFYPILNVYTKILSHLKCFTSGLASWTHSLPGAGVGFWLKLGPLMAVPCNLGAGITKTLSSGQWDARMFQRDAGNNQRQPRHPNPAWHILLCIDYDFFLNKTLAGTQDLVGQWGLPLAADM